MVMTSLLSTSLRSCSSSHNGTTPEQPLYPGGPLGRGRKMRSTNLTECWTLSAQPQAREGFIVSVDLARQVMPSPCLGASQESLTRALLVLASVPSQLSRLETILSVELLAWAPACERLPGSTTTRIRLPAGTSNGRGRGNAVL